MSGAKTADVLDNTKVGDIGDTVFQSDLSTKIADKITEGNNPDSSYSVKVVSESSELLDLGDGTVSSLRKSYPREFITKSLRAIGFNDLADQLYARAREKRLATYPDTRLQDRDEDGLRLAQKGIDLRKPKSGMTYIVFDKEQNEPIAVGNVLVETGEQVESKRYLKKVVEGDKVVGYKVVGFREAFNIPEEEEVPKVITPGWHFILPEHRLEIGVAKKIANATRTIVETILESEEAQNSIVMAEQNGEAFNAGYIPDLERYKIGDVISVDDPIWLHPTTGKSIIDIVGVPTTDSKMVRNAAEKNNLVIATDIIHFESLGPVYTSRSVKEA